MKWWTTPFLITTGLTALPAAVPAATQAADPAGRWNTPWGEMRLQRDDRQVSGEYGRNGGRLSGRMEGNTFDGYWFQAVSDRRCDRALSGTPYWGRVRLSFSGNRFDGWWSYCEQAPERGGWDGTRITADTPAKPLEDDPTALVLGALAKALPPEASKAIGELLDEEVSPSPATPPATAKNATPPPAVTYEMARGELWTDWKAGLRNGRPQTLTGDLSCDGAADYFVGWTELDNPDRKRYHIAVVYHEGARLTHHHASLDLGGDGQSAVCVANPDDYPTITLAGHPLTDASRAAYSLPPGCTGAVRLDDGICDAIYIGWEPARKQFILHRN